MSSEGRYLYHHPPPGIPTTSYDYTSYSYNDSSQITQSQPPQMRTMRHNSSQSRSPHPPPPFPASQASYQANYAPSAAAAVAAASYAITPQTQPWTAEGWSSYPPPSFPSQSLPEVAFNSGPGRPEQAPAQPPSDSRLFAPAHAHASPDARRNERHLDPVGLPSKERRREKDVPPTMSFPAASGVDFLKLLETYRIIMDGGHNLTAEGQNRTPNTTLEMVQRMLHSADYGAQVLDSAIAQPIPPVISVPTEPRSQSQREADEPKNENVDGAAAPKPQKSNEVTQEGQICLGCNATSTPEWRRGPMGPRTLCNACGLVYAKLIKKRVREGGRASGKLRRGTGTEPQAGDDSGQASSGDGPTDEEMSDGSHERAREFEEHD